MRKKNQETKKLVGYSVPVCLWGKDCQPNEKEQAFFDVLNNVTDITTNFLENDYGADVASSLSSPFYYKQVEYTDKKGRRKPKKIHLLLQYSMQKLFIQRNPRRYFLFSKQKEKKMLIH